MTTNGETTPGAEDTVESEPNLLDVQAHDDDSAEVLNEKLKLLNRLKDDVAAAINSFGNPDTAREKLLESTKRYAKQLHMDFDDTSSLGILADMPEAIADYEHDVIELLAKKQQAN